MERNLARRSWHLEGISGRQSQPSELDESFLKNRQPMAVRTGRRGPESAAMDARPAEIPAPRHFRRASSATHSRSARQLQQTELDEESKTALAPAAFPRLGFFDDKLDHPSPDQDRRASRDPRDARKPGRPPKRRKTRARRRVGSICDS